MVVGRPAQLLKRFWHSASQITTSTLLKSMFYFFIVQITSKCLGGFDQYLNLYLTHVELQHIYVSKYDQTAVAKWLTFSRATFDLKSTVIQLSRSYISINLSRIAVTKGANFSERVHKEVWSLKEQSSTNIYRGQIQEVLIGWDLGVQTLVQKRLLNVLWQTTSHRDDHVFLNLWTSVAVAREMVFCKQMRTDHRRVPKRGVWMKIEVASRFQ